MVPRPQRCFQCSRLFLALSSLAFHMFSTNLEQANVSLWGINCGKPTSVHYIYYIYIYLFIIIYYQYSIIYIYILSYIYISTYTVYNICILYSMFNIWYDDTGTQHAYPVHSDIVASFCIWSLLLDAIGPYWQTGLHFACPAIARLSVQQGNPTCNSMEMAMAVKPFISIPGVRLDENEHSIVQSKIIV